MRFRGSTLLLLVYLLLGCNRSSPSPTDPGSTDTCLSRAIFGPPAASLYVLPYPTGSQFRVTQSYCNPNGGHNGTFAYDFDLPLDSPVTASRDGIVLVANDQYPDTDHTEGHENNVFVEHSDGSVVRYTHLAQGSIVVAVGDSVVQGERLGSGGNSGNTGGVPHLHFEVFRSRNYNKSNTVPINFRNADGPLDTRNGLAAGRTYLAL